MLDYFVNHYWLVWFIVAGVLLILELGFGDFFLTCLAVGALVALVFSLFSLPFGAQVLVFAMTGVASIYLLRPRLLHALQAKADHRESNAEGLIGRTGVVVEPVDAGKDGYVKVDGDVWRAKSKDGSPIAAGKNVRIVSMESIVVTVVAV